MLALKELLNFNIIQKKFKRYFIKNLLNYSNRQFTSNLKLDLNEMEKTKRKIVSEDESDSEIIKIINNISFPKGQNHFNDLEKKFNDTMKEEFENFKEDNEENLESNDDKIIIESSDILKERNFNTLIIDSHASISFILKFPVDMIHDFCKLFSKVILVVENNSEIENSYKNFLIERNYFTSEELALKEAKNILNSLLIIWEFLDRGMKGFLTGDVSYHLIKNAGAIIENYLTKLNEIESDFKNLGIDPNYFYESFFKIDKKFYKNNKAKNLVLDLSRYFDSRDIKNRKMLYFVNIKHTQFFDLFKSKVAIMLSNKDDKIKLSEEAIKQVINDKKNKVQLIFNDLYNEIIEHGIANKLKTPFNGILHAHKENKYNLFRRQLLIEENTFDRANEEFIKTFNQLQENDKVQEMEFNRNIMKDWWIKLNVAINEFQKVIIDNQEFKKKKNSYLKYFIALNSNEISIVCLLYIIKIIINNMTLGNDDLKNQEKYLKILNRIEIDEDEFQIDIPLVEFSENLGDLFFLEYRNFKLDEQFKNSNARLYFKNLSENLLNYEITKKEKIQIGITMTNILLKNITFSNDKNDIKNKQSVLKIVKKHIKDGKYQNYIAIDKDFVYNYYQDIQKTFNLSIQIKKSLPMIFHPASWKNFKIGCYYLRQTQFSKVKTDNLEALYLLEKFDLSKVMKALDTLSSVRWRINNNVLDLVEYVWSIGGDKKDIPKRYNERLVTTSMINDKKQITEKIKLLKESQDNREDHSKRCDFMLKLQVAREFANCSEIYYPSNIDYRGRAYPISPHLNHLGTDLNRGLLEYSESKPLGKNGMKWLKIHLANVMGKDKLSLDDRLKYIDSNINTVIKCAKDPYKNMEWLESENPWQTIATMIEISNAISNSNPENYKTNLHVHVDGSCNGLQHYSALGRDYNGGLEVNLINREKPADVYTKVLEIVLEKIKNEKNEEDIKCAELLKRDGVVNRKVIKQTVMTSVYGVKLIGARDQMKRQLKETGLFDSQSLFLVSMYLAKIVIQSIGDLFKEANLIKEWLTKCALIVSNSGSTVKWRTPMGLPCVQPYKKISSTDIVKTYSQGVVIISDYENQKVNITKQGSAFPPNYIHSLDSTHMMLTCLRAAEKNIVFSSVHDSFWCHPCDIDYLNQHTREEFVRLYSEPILENLLRDFKCSYPELKFPDIPNRGSLDLKEVLKSTYFFS